MVQVVQGITYSAKGHTHSALDLVLTSVPKKMSEARALVYAYSDHNGALHKIHQEHHQQTPLHQEEIKLEL
jgi:hypothetical protein